MPRTVPIMETTDQGCRPTRQIARLFDALGRALSTSGLRRWE